MAAVAQIRGTNRMRNFNVVNNHPTGLTSQDVRDLLASDSVDLMVGCRRSFLFAVRLYSCYPKRPILYESSALDAIRAWSHRRLLRSVNLLPIREIPAKRGQCRLRLMHMLGDQEPKRERMPATGWQECSASQAIPIGSSGPRQQRWMLQPNSSMVPWARLTCCPPPPPAARAVPRPPPAAAPMAAPLPPPAMAPMTEPSPAPVATLRAVCPPCPCPCS